MDPLSNLVYLPTAKPKGQIGAAVDGGPLGRTAAWGMTGKATSRKELDELRRWGWGSVCGRSVGSVGGRVSGMGAGGSESVGVRKDWELGLQSLTT